MPFQKRHKPHNKGKKGWTNSGSFQKGHKGYRNSGNFKKGHVPASKGTYLTEKEKQEVSRKTRIGMNKSEVKEKLRKPKPESQREKLRQSMIKNWENPVYRERQVMLRMQGMQIKPNKPEKIIIQLLSKIIPNEYKYVGDGQFILGGKCPDFLNINGKKKLIEFFGNYWHSKAVTGIEPDQHEKERIGYFKRFGFDTLIIWGYELKNLKKVENQIIQFTNL